MSDSLQPDRLQASLSITNSWSLLKLPLSIILPKIASAMPLPHPELHRLSTPCEEPMPSGLTVKVLTKQAARLPAQLACWEPSHSCQTEKSASLSPNCPPVRRRRTLLLLAHPTKLAKGPSAGPSVCGKEHEETEG